MAGGRLLWRIVDGLALNVRVMFVFVSLEDGEKFKGRNALAYFDGAFVLAVGGRFGGLGVPGGSDRLGGDGAQRCMAPSITIGCCEPVDANVSLKGASFGGNGALVIGMGVGKGTGEDDIMRRFGRCGRYCVRGETVRGSWAKWWCSSSPYMIAEGRL
jgi:hypothetical protein